MTCPICSATLSNTAKFCEQCGTKAPLEGDEAIALEIANAALIEAGAAPMPKFENADEKAVGMIMLAKARELLCGPKDAEIARLKVELQAERKHYETLSRMHKQMCELAGERGKALEAERNAAANARREALEQVRKLANSEGILTGPFPAIDVFWQELGKMIKDSQPAAETRACSDPACGQCACQSVRPATPKPDPAVSLPIIAGPLTDVPGDPYAPTGQQASKVGRADERLRQVIRNVLTNGRSPTVDEQVHAIACWVESRQPPARDVERLARVLATKFGWPLDHADNVASEVFAWVGRQDGGPKT